MEDVSILLYGANRCDREQYSVITYHFTVGNIPIGVKMYVERGEEDYNTLLSEGVTYAYLCYKGKGERE